MTAAATLEIIHQQAGFDRVGHQHRDRHRPDTARNRRNRARSLRDAVKIDIANKPVATLAAGIIHAIDPNIDHDHAFAHVIRFYEVRLPDGCDDYVGAMANLVVVHREPSGEPFHPIATAAVSLAIEGGRVVFDRDAGRGE